jgi:hypothetical protein
VQAVRRVDEEEEGADFEDEDIGEDRGDEVGLPLQNELLLAAAGKVPPPDDPDAEKMRR